jgi:hypothetical protein
VFGRETAYVVELYNPSGGSPRPKSGGAFQPTFCSQSSPTRTLTIAITALFTRDGRSGTARVAESVAAT